MQGYLKIILEACVLFPVIAALITLPYTIHQYRKFGSVTFPRIFLVYSLVLYLMCAYFLVILPLPAREEVAAMTGPAAQLIPFSFFRDLSRETVFVLTEPSTWLPALASNFTLQFVFNIALLVPLGFYLRYYFRRRLPSTVLICFCVSLFFELTQLSGLYGFYPRAYRLFDVDDLLCNTLGGLLGYALTGPLLHILPNRDSIDEKAYEKGERVTFTRRLLSFCVDLVFVSLLATPLSLLPFPEGFSVFVPFLLSYLLYFVLFQWLCRGKTLGKRLTKIRVGAGDGSPASLPRMLLRYGFVAAEIIALEAVSYLLSMPYTSGVQNAYQLIYLFLLAGLYLLLVFLFLLETILNRVSQTGRDYLHGRISRTRLWSTVLPEEGAAPRRKKRR